MGFRILIGFEPNILLILVHTFIISKALWFFNGFICNYGIYIGKYSIPILFNISSFLFSFCISISYSIKTPIPHSLKSHPYIKIQQGANCMLYIFKAVNNKIKLLTLSITVTLPETHPFQLWSWSIKQCVSFTETWIVCLFGIECNIQIICVDSLFLFWRSFPYVTTYCLAIYTHSPHIVIQTSWELKEMGKRLS